MFPLALLAVEDDEDRAFMAQLYVDHRALMYAKALAVLHDRQDIEDVIGDACVALQGKISLIQTLNGYALKAYIVSTVRNTAINLIARRDRQGKHAYLDANDQLYSVPSEEPEILGALIRREDIERLKAGIRQLNQRERAALTMKYFDDLPDAEIAQVLGIKADSVRPCLMRARRRLYEHMKE